MIFPYDTYGVFLTGHSDFAAFSGNLSVGVNPERLRSLYGEFWSFVGSYAFKAVMSSLEGGGQGEQDQQFWQIAHSAHV